MNTRNYFCLETFCAISLMLIAFINCAAIDHEQCGINEYFSPTGGPKCENCGPVCLVLLYDPGCFCLPRYRRIQKYPGVCIPEELCPGEPPIYPGHPGQCGINEFFSPTGGPACEGCGFNCQVFITVPKCNCIPGYRRIQKNPGVCIPEELCPVILPVNVDDPEQCGINEVFSLTGGPLCENCGPRCEAFTNEPKCYCLPGFRRIQKNPGVCMPEDMCPSILFFDLNDPEQCGINEVFSPTGGPVCEGCGATCQAYTREPKCNCFEGYRRIRREPGACIPKEYCPNVTPVYPGNYPQCGINEIFSPDGGALCENCGPRCLALTSEPKCYCKPGHSRIQSNPGICIPDRLCPGEPPLNPDNHQQCGINEEFSPDGGPACENCGPRCLVFSTEPKCYCLQGYSRVQDDPGVCIPNDLCPKNPPNDEDNHQQCGINEEFSPDGGPACENCGPRCLVFSTEPKCYCLQGYSRIQDDPGVCIPNNLCPKNPPNDAGDTEHCGLNEVFSPKGGPLCEGCGYNCQAVTHEPKCNCLPGYRRIQENPGVCIPEDLCPEVTPPTYQICPDNEEPGCEEPKECETCDDGNPEPTVDCIDGCSCSEGFYRDEEGICIPEDECPLPICPDYEEPGCEQPPGCGTCEHKDPCPTFDCNDGCNCVEGFYRNDESICIPEDECPTPTDSPIQCGINEIYSPTGGPICEGCGFNCEAITLEPKCNCLPGTRRIRKNPGVCIPEELCSVIPPDNLCPPNEEPGCEQPKVCVTCENKEQCPTLVCSDGCNCIEGFYRDADGICIPEDECPKPICPDNEEPGCEQPKDCVTCEHKEQCPTFDCVDGCNCIDGFYRDADGICIPEDECPKPICPTNEEPGCEQPKDCVTCEHKEQCPTFDCVDGCNCIEGFYRDEEEACIPEDECPMQTVSPVQCNINEAYSSTGGPLCEGCDYKCEGISEEAKCYCLPGYRRIGKTTGVCIPDELCSMIPPKNQCPINEELECEQPKDCVTCENKNVCDEVDCVVGCNCIEGYYRDKEGTCIPEEECPTPIIPECGLNEEYNPNGGPVCEGCGPRCQSASDEPRCYCIEGHSRILPNVCIPDNLCPKS